MEPRFTAIADHALLVAFADEISEEAHSAVLALDKALGSHPPDGVIETVPALVNVLVCFDPLITDHAALEHRVRTCIQQMKVAQKAGAQRHIHVCYEDPFAADLDKVSEATGLSRETVINTHLAGQFQVLMYGFAPGYAYLSGVPQDIRVPRKTAALRDVPAGSVIIAGQQCLVTTLTMPTGWSIIGRSPTPILTGDSGRPFLFDVGDRVVFERIDLNTFESISADGSNG